MKKFLKSFALELITVILVFFRYDIKRFGKRLAKDYRKLRYSYQLNTSLSQRLYSLVDGLNNPTQKRHQINLFGDLIANKVQRLKTWS